MEKREKGVKMLKEAKKIPYGRSTKKDRMRRKVGIEKIDDATTDKGGATERRAACACHLGRNRQKLAGGKSTVGLVCLNQRANDPQSRVLARLLATVSSWRASVVWRRSGQRNRAY